MNTEMNCGNGVSNTRMERYGALIAVDNKKFYDKETYYSYIQTNIKIIKKTSIDDVRKAKSYRRAFIVNTILFVIQPTIIPLYAVFPGI